MKVRLSHVQIIALGFFILIAAGTILLSLPIATRSGETAPFVTALFTSVSASCVTGFVLEDTALFWSGFGQVVILLQIQIGGLGVMTIATLFFMLMSRRVGLRQREVIVESLNTTQVGGIMHLLRQIGITTLIFEVSGAVLLATRFIPRYGLGRGLWYGVFHSVSAFCNAGFDLLGVEGEFSSFTAFSDDLVVNLTMIILIVVGGIGFLVWGDVIEHGFHFRRFKLQSKIAVHASAVLILGGALLFWMLERKTLSAMPIGEQILVSLFSSVTSRNAGFSTVDAATIGGGGRFLLMVLMFIGGSSGSTAGGVKTTTITVLFVHALRVIRHERCSNIFQRRIDDETVNRAVAVVMVNLGMVISGMLLLCLVQELPLEYALFDVISAVGTAGMSVGIIRELNVFSQFIVMVLMFLGRLGSVSFAVAMLEKRAHPAIQYPAEKITVG